MHAGKRVSVEDRVLNVVSNIYVRSNRKQVVCQQKPCSRLFIENETVVLNVSGIQNDETGGGVSTKGAETTPTRCQNNLK